MIAAPLGLLTLAFGMLSALAIIAGGIVLFAVGRGRGALPGAGFVVLGVGTGISGLISVLLPRILLASHLSGTALAGGYASISFVSGLIGWGLVIAALFRLRAEKVNAPGPDPRQGPYSA